ncbi:unnamed protein product [Ectocarpus sp. CCAP 1310/34]|nr:unnamed protein product [Ectocarpus sp. CCAP 1310/34]
MALNQSDAGVPAASVNDAELDARLTGMEQRLGEAMEGRMQAMMSQVMSQLPSLMRGALDVGGVQQEEESGGDVGASTGASGDAAAPNSSQGSAATGTVGVGGYGRGYGSQGETAATGGGVGGVFVSGDVAGEGLFTGGGGISKLAASHVNPPQLKKGAEQYPGRRQDMIVQAGILDIGDVFSGGGVLPDINKPQTALLEQGFSYAAIRKTYLAWKFLSAALTTETDKAILRRCTNPREALRQLDAAYLPETQGAQQQLFREFQQYQTPRKENPVASLNKLMGMANMMRQGGGATVNDQFVFARLIDSLPNPEYEITKQTLSVVQPLTRDILVQQLSTRFNLLTEEWRKEGEKGSGGEQAYIAGDGTGKGRQAGGGRGSKSNGRGSKKKAGTDDRVDHRRCFRCNHRGHRIPDCTTKKLEQCDTCSGFGHNREKCATPTEEACMAVVEHPNFAVVSFEEQYDRAEELCKMDPGWEKLTEDEKEAKVQEVITESF